VVLRNSLRLHRLIDGLLDLARLEAGQLRLRVGTVDTVALVQGVVAAFQPAAESMGIKLKLELPPSPLDAPLMGDSEKLEVVLTNLLGNALKFTERSGRIDVAVRQKSPDPTAADGDPAKSGAIEITVSDNGPGIPLTEQPYIFERFRRVESPGRKQGGAGIGLALVKELVELHGGTVSIDSQPGTGARFLVRLRTGIEHWSSELIEAEAGRSTSADGHRPTVDNPALAHVTDGIDPRLDAARSSSSQGLAALLPHHESARPHIVVAEDNPDLRSFLYELLSPYYNVTAVADGRAALEAVRERLPDIVLSDVMMPHQSGTELCREVKRDPRTRAIPVILLTARTGIDETLDGFGHGAADYLVKPFSPRELLVRVAVQLKVRRLTAQVANAARLAAVGTLAAGVAHEIKNPLNAISTGAAALRKRNELTPTMQAEVLEMMEECVQRISEITTALTDHARPADGEGLSMFDVRQGLDSTLRLLADRLRSGNVTVDRHYLCELFILGRPRQLNQVFLNLFDNALRESPSGGHIHVTLRDSGHGTLVLSVSDDGTGVPSENRERIFDPFFTTRQPGEGTGLGLYLSRQIVEAHGGSMRVGEAPSGGAQFIVELPLGGIESLAASAASDGLLAGEQSRSREGAAA
jgi:signal transduction histidine kinase